jgi:predicted Abi (CAAX) family protease
VVAVAVVVVVLVAVVVAVVVVVDSFVQENDVKRVPKISIRAIIPKNTRDLTVCLLTIQSSFFSPVDLDV